MKIKEMVTKEKLASWVKNQILSSSFNFLLYNILQKFLCAAIYCSNLNL